MCYIVNATRFFMNKRFIIIIYSQTQTADPSNCYFCTCYEYMILIKDQNSRTEQIDITTVLTNPII